MITESQDIFGLLYAHVTRSWHADLKAFDTTSIFVSSHISSVNDITRSLLKFSAPSAPPNQPTTSKKQKCAKQGCISSSTMFFTPH